MPDLVDEKSLSEAIEKLVELHCPELGAESARALCSAIERMVRRWGDISATDALYCVPVIPPGSSE